MCFLYDTILAITTVQNQIQIGPSSVKLTQIHFKNSLPDQVYLAIFQDSSKPNEYYILLRTSDNHRLVKKVALVKPVTIGQLNLGTYKEITMINSQNGSTLKPYTAMAKSDINSIEASEKAGTTPPPFPDWGNVVNIINNAI